MLFAVDSFLMTSLLLLIFFSFCSELLILLFLISIIVLELSLFGNWHLLQNDLNAKFKLLHLEQNQSPVLSTKGFEIFFFDLILLLTKRLFLKDLSSIKYW